MLDLYKNVHTITVNLGICRECAQGLHLCQRNGGCKCPECQRQRGFRIGAFMWSLPAITGGIAAFSQIAAYILPGLPPYLLLLSLALFTRGGLKILNG